MASPAASTVVDCGLPSMLAKAVRSVTERMDPSGSKMRHFHRDSAIEFTVDRSNRAIRTHRDRPEPAVRTERAQEHAVRAEHLDVHREPSPT